MSAQRPGVKVVPVCGELLRVKVRPLNSYAAKLFRAREILREASFRHPEWIVRRNA